MRKRLSAIVVLLVVLSACSSHQESNAFKAIEAARMTYTALQALAIDLNEREFISTRAWNQDIVPLDNKIHATLTRCYGYLRLYVAVGQEADLLEYARLLREVQDLLSEYQALINSFNKVPGSPAADNAIQGTVDNGVTNAN